MSPPMLYSLLHAEYTLGMTPGVDRLLPVRQNDINKAKAKEEEIKRQIENLEVPETEHVLADVESVIARGPVGANNPGFPLMPQPVSQMMPPPVPPMPASSAPDTWQAAGKNRRTDIRPPPPTIGKGVGKAAPAVDFTLPKPGQQITAEQRAQFVAKIAQLSPEKLEQLPSNVKDQIRAILG